MIHLVESIGMEKKRIVFLVYILVDRIHSRPLTKIGNLEEEQILQERQ